MCFASAYTRFGREIPYLCHSWLLYPGLTELLKPDSNIIRFQELFSLLQTDTEGTEAEWRIFGKVLPEPREYRLAEGGKALSAGGEKAGERTWDSFVKGNCIMVSVQDLLSGAWTGIE